MARDYSAPWSGSQSQVNQVSAATGDSFVQNQPLSGPYSYNAASNNLWINKYGQGAAGFWGNAQRYGEAYAISSWKSEQAVNASTPVYNISVAAKQTVVTPPVVATPAATTTGLLLNVGSPDLMRQLNPVPLVMVAPVQSPTSIAARGTVTSGPSRDITTINNPNALANPNLAVPASIPIATSTPSVMDQVSNIFSTVTSQSPTSTVSSNLTSSAEGMIQSINAAGGIWLWAGIGAVVLYFIMKK